jgi:endoglucanase
MKRELSFTFVLLGLAATSLGCHVKSDAGLKQGADATKPCGKEAIIDDGEDGNNQVLVQDGRAGYWYTFLDDAGSTIEPQAGKKGGQFAMSPGGNGGSAMAARMHGKVTTGGVLYAGMGFNFVDPKDQYDATKYGGVAFYAKKGPGSTGKVRLKIPDVDTDPDGKVCKECFNDFGAVMELTDGWTRYELPFVMASQEQGWGKPKPSHINPAKLYAMQWQVNVPGAEYDIYVDDVAFVGCQ